MECQTNKVEGSPLVVNFFVFVFVFVFVFLFQTDGISMGRRIKRAGKGKKKCEGKLSQEDLDYLAKNTSMSEESIQEFYQASC